MKVNTITKVMLEETKKNAPTVLVEHTDRGRQMNHLGEEVLIFWCQDRSCCFWTAIHLASDGEGN